MHVYYSGRLSERSFFLSVRAFIKESVHISNYQFLEWAFITSAFTRECVCKRGVYLRRRLFGGGVYLIKFR